MEKEKVKKIEDICELCKSSSNLIKRECSKGHQWFLCPEHSDEAHCPFCAEDYYYKWEGTDL